MPRVNRPVAARHMLTLARSGAAPHRLRQYQADLIVALDLNGLDTRWLCRLTDAAVRIDYRAAEHREKERELIQRFMR